MRNKRAHTIRLGDKNKPYNPTGAWKANRSKQSESQRIDEANLAGAAVSREDDGTLVFECRGESCGGRMLPLEAYQLSITGTRSTSCNYCTGVKQAHTMAVANGLEEVRVKHGSDPMVHVGRIEKAFPQFYPEPEAAPMLPLPPAPAPAPAPEAATRTNRDVAVEACRLIDDGFTADQIVSMAALAEVL